MHCRVDKIGNIARRVLRVLGCIGVVFLVAALMGGAIHLIKDWTVPYEVIWVLMALVAGVLLCVAYGVLHYIICVDDDKRG